jgi:hypothetical protein
MRKLKHDLLAPIFAQIEVNAWANVLGDGEANRKVAEFIVEVQRELPQGSLSGKKPSGQIKPNPTKSEPIQPNPTKFSNGHPPPANSHDDAT